MSSKDTGELIEALSYWNSDNFKRTQRKLSTAAKTIEEEALSNSFKSFLSDSEISTLMEAVAILRNVKKNVEHAKEIKSRDEKIKKEVQEKAGKLGKQAWLVNFPKPKSTVELFIVAMCFSVYGMSSDFLVYLEAYDRDNIERLLNRYWSDAREHYIDKITTRNGWDRCVPDDDLIDSAKIEYQNRRKGIIKTYSEVLKILAEYEASVTSNNV